MKIIWACILGLCCWLVAGTVSAQDPEEPMKTAAKALYNEAREARKTEDFATCYAKATAAWAIHKHPSIAALVGDCGVGVGKYRDGAEKLQAFFDSPRKVGSEDLRNHLKGRLEEAKRHIGVVTVTVSVADAACEVDGVRLEQVPATVYLDPGSHAFEARHSDFQTVTRQVNVGAGMTLDVHLELKPKPDPKVIIKPDPNASEGPGIGYLVGAGVSGGVAVGGLVLMIVSVVLHGSASDTIEELDASIANDSACDPNALSGDCAELDSAISDQSTFATLFPVGIIIAGVGAAAGATFLVLHFVGPESTEASLHVTPTGVALRGSF